MVATLERRGDLSTTTVRYAHAVLRIALNRAVKTGRVIRNVATLVETPRKAESKIRPLTADQVRAFLASVRATNSRRSTPAPSRSGCARASYSACAGPTSTSTPAP